MGLVKEGHMKTYHVLPPFHEFLVDHLACIVLARLDVHGFLHDGIRPTPERLSSTIL